MLQGAEKQKAWKEGACLNCGQGKQGHMIKGCPAIKKEDQKKGKKPKRHLHKMDSQDEEAGAKESDSSVSDFTSESSGPASPTAGARRKTQTQSLRGGARSRHPSWCWAPPLARKNPELHTQLFAPGNQPRPVGCAGSCPKVSSS
eukprot:749813-Rhodomonas_salina.1